VKPFDRQPDVVEVHKLAVVDCLGTSGAADAQVSRVLSRPFVALALDMSDAASSMSVARHGANQDLRPHGQQLAAAAVCLGVCAQG
jgi:hypothetical protein